MAKRKIVVATEHNLAKLQSLDPKKFVIHAYKVIAGTPAELKAGKGKPPYYAGSGVRYRLGGSKIEKFANTDVRDECGRGLNVATKSWCLDEWVLDDRQSQKLGLYVVEINPKHIACMPRYVSWDGDLVEHLRKFRVYRLKVLKRVRWS